MIKRIKPKSAKEMEMNDWKPRKFPQLVLPRENFPEPDECEPGTTYFVELEVKLWENDKHTNEKGETGKLSFDVLAVHGVEDSEDEKKEPKEPEENMKEEKGQKKYKRV